MILTALFSCSFSYEIVMFSNGELMFNDVELTFGNVELIFNDAEHNLSVGKDTTLYRKSKISLVFNTKNRYGIISRTYFLYLYVHPKSDFLN